MKTVLVLAALLPLATLLPSPAGAAAPDADAIMQKSEEAGRIRDLSSSVTITTTDEGRPPKAKKLRWWRRLTEAKRFKTLTRFDDPPDIRGEAILFVEQDRDTSDIQLYLPSSKRVRRVEGQSQSSSFMGSAFSYSDVASPHADDYTHRLKGQTPCPEEPATPCYVIESRPASDKVRERTGYGRLVQWISSRHFLALAGEFYDPDDKLAKRMRATQIKEVDAATHKWFAHRVQMSDEKKKRNTVVAFENVKVNLGLSDALFTEQELKRE